MDRLLSLTSFILVSLNLALDAGSHQGSTAYDRLSPIHCLHDTVHALVGIFYSNAHNNKDTPGDVRHPPPQPLIRPLNVLAVLAFCASLFQDGHVGQKLLLANAMLCWLLGNTTDNRPAAPAPAPALAMSSNLVLALLEHSAVFAMTECFDPDDPRCWKWLAMTCVPVVLLSCLLSRPRPEGRQHQDLQIEVLASLLHVLSLGSLWLFGFSPMAKRHFALHDPRTTFHGLDHLQVIALVWNTCALQCCLLQHKHRTAGRTWPAVMPALVYVVMVCFYYLVCYPLY